MLTTQGRVLCPESCFGLERWDPLSLPAKVPGQAGKLAFHQPPSSPASLCGAPWTSVWWGEEPSLVWGGALQGGGAEGSEGMLGFQVGHGGGLRAQCLPTRPAEAQLPGQGHRGGKENETDRGQQEGWGRSGARPFPREFSTFVGSEPA